MPIASRIYEFDAFRADLGRQVLLHEGTPVHLPPKTFSLLAALLARHGEVVPKDELIAALWPDTVGTEANLSVNVAALRRVLGEKPKEHRYIVTVPQRGYAFVAEVKEIEPAAGAADRVAAPADEAPVRHLAVLPFRVLDGGEGGDLLGLGFTDGLITHLAKIPALSVRSTGAVRRFTGDPVAPGTAGAELQVGDVVEGTVSRAGDHLTATVQLVRCQDGALTWAETYGARLSELHQLQIRITEDLLRELKIRRDPAHGPARIEPPSHDTAAFGLYLQARAHSSGYDPESLMKSVQLFEAALARDPEFAMAHTGLAAVYHTLWILGRLTTEQAVARIEEEARKALTLDSALAEAHTWLGNMATVYRYDLAEAESHFLRSLELSPNTASTLRFYAAFLIVSGQFAKALETARRGQILDPTSMHINLLVASALYYGGEYERAAGLFRAMSEVEPRFPWARFMLAWTLIQLRRDEEALDALRQPSSRLLQETLWGHALMGHLEAKLGRPDAALRHLKAMEAETPHQAPSTATAILHLGLEDTARTMEALEQGYAERHPFICYLHVDPFWDPIRDEPRFRNLMQRIGFPSR